MYTEKIKEFIESHKDEMTELLGRLVAVRSVQGEAEEGYPFGRKPAEALEIMLEQCFSSGFNVENVENYVGTAEYGENPALGILCHLDVVPEGDGWEADPYTMRIDAESGKLIGRGTIDDKGPAVAALYALKAVKELGIPLKKGVRLLFGTNEENGSADLAYYRKKRDLPPMVFTPDGEYPVINAEKGMIRVYFSAEMKDDEEIAQINAGSVVNAVPGRCRVVYRSEDEEGVTVDYNGIPAHASTPAKGDNAITRFLSEYSGENELFIHLGELFPHGELNGRSCGLGFSDDISGEMTCVLSMLNTEEGAVRGAIDIRFPLDRKIGEIREIICGSLEGAGFTVDSAEGTDPHCTDESSKFVQSLLRVYERLTGEKGRSIAIGGGTYVHEIEGGVAFGAEFPGVDYNMHGPEEFITVGELMLNARMIAEAITELCT